MDAQRWTVDQMLLRETVRAQRRTPDGRSPLAPGQPARSLDVRAPEPIGTSERPVTEAVPLVSVIVVCWNAADVLGRCLDQLLAQAYASYEIIVVDDGSEDDTLEIAESRSTGGEVTLVRSPRNRGCPHARNLGLRQAKGEIIAFIDADGFAQPNWLRGIVDAFGADVTIGGVASTVFFAGNPLVLNGAGGTVNRQGWAADLSMNESYERAEIASEALYPMGCGMAVRRSAVERVGQFDDRMLNYYDDVDYGTRLWRAGYRVVVAPDAWIDHGFGVTGGDSAHKRLLCERHRMRVVLKHAPLRVAREMGGGRGAHDHASALDSPRLQAEGDGVERASHAERAREPLALARRSFSPGSAPRSVLGRRLPRGRPVAADAASRKRRRTASTCQTRAAREQLIYGWFPAEQVDGRSYRWAGVQAAALIALEAPVRRLRLDYAHVPADIGGVDVCIRRLGSAEPLTPGVGHPSVVAVHRAVGRESPARAARR